jgi:Neuraminidase (sialidase)
MKRWLLAVLLFVIFAGGVIARDETVVTRHVTVYHEPGRLGAWPANHGIWSWGNEILVGFSSAYFKWLGPDSHPYDRDKPEEPYLARSRDGGVTWNFEAAPSLVPPEGMYTAVGPAPGRSTRAVPQPGKIAELAEPLDFTHPDFAMTLRMTDPQQGGSWLFYSYDRGKTWKGPFRFPMLGQTAIMARTDYIVNGKREAMVFLTAAKAKGREGRPFVARTRDGGLTWQFVAWVAPDPDRGFTIMPSSVRLSKTEILSIVRHRVALPDGANWIDAYVSRDNGTTWQYLSRPAGDTGAKGGNAPSTIRLKDGRIVVTYGYRAKPYSIRARLSSDNGKTWGEEIMLRDGGGAWDLGYPRTVQRPDGKIVTVYYWVNDPKKERVIEATIWDPGPARK